MGYVFSMDGVAGWSDPRTDWAVPGMRTLQVCKERNGQIHVQIWPFVVTGDVARPVSMKVAPTWH